MKPDTPAPSSSSLDRLLRVIDLFTPDRPQWTADEIGQVMGVSRATQYRYIKALTSSGLLASAGAGDGGYRLGPRFVVLDRQIRLSDPLLQLGPPVMARASRKLGAAQLLCTYFGDQVLCIHQESVDPAIHSSMERGRPFPLFRGSPSRAILAWLPDSQLRSLMLAHAQEIHAAGLGANWNEFKQKVRAIRADGHYIGRGEIDEDLMGVGVPILRDDGDVVGSLTTIMPLRERRTTELERVIQATRAAAEEIASGLTPSTPVPQLRSRGARSR
ncbi:IclR family transcriptional regulator [Hydrogenophaga sp.]|uniref:IclR family transcriptional regulator n=1 Tax=Hydrogenophaga sp. TaxID=1904254 RepID=UPI002638C2E6|nr:IclR family transcriptional regulator [Hydrogenophaga sp.]MCW5653030.1 IclR family transcriptional regulator [Hydrogenophaga sp.]